MDRTFDAIGVSISNMDSIQTSMELGVAADKSGFSSLFLPEGIGWRSGLMTQMAIATQTENLKLGIGIITPYVRQLTTIAMDALAINEVSRGRFMLGLGAPLWKIAPYGFTLENTKPLQTMREAYQVLKQLIAGETVDPGSEYFGIPKGVTVDRYPKYRDVPIFFGFINKLLLRLSGEIGDAVQLGAATHVEYAKWAVKQIYRGAKRAGRDPETIPIYGNILTALAEDKATGRELVKPMLSRYIAIVEKIMFINTPMTEDKLEAYRELFKTEPKQAIDRYLTDDVIDAFAITGTHEDIIKGFEGFLGTGVRYPLVWSVFGAEPVKAIKSIGENVLPHLPIVK
jgi:5,10-methylenetetrahydromethanopterin reductase